MRGRLVAESIQVIMQNPTNTSKTAKNNLISIFATDEFRGNRDLANTERKK